jgi:O-antigen/teichoic acid export membrane protein
VAAAHGVWCVHSRQPLKITWGLKLYGDVLKFGIKLYVASVLSFLSVYLVGLIVAIYLTAAEVAFFQIAQARAILLAQIASAVGTVLYARVSSLGSDSNDGTQLAVTTFRITLLLTGCAALAALALAYPAVHLIYGAAYGGVVLPLLIFLPAVAIDSAGGPLNQFYIGRGRPGVTTIFVLVALISQLATLWIAVPRWGVTGAAIATASAMALGTVVRILAFFMMFKVRLKDMLRPTRADFLFVFGFVRSRLASAMAAVPLLRPR